jgi:hypothetical protein
MLFYSIQGIDSLPTGKKVITYSGLWLHFLRKIIVEQQGKQIFITTVLRLYPERQKHIAELHLPQ